MNFKRILAVLSAALMTLCLTACDASTLTGTSTTATDSTSASSGSSYMIFIYFAVIIVVFYFLLIRPENKRKKKAQELRNNISVGQEITTIGGMTGTIVSVNGDFVTFETGEDRVRIEIAKWAISSQGRANNQ